MNSKSSKSVILNTEIKGKRHLTVEKIICWNCSAEIVQYYNDDYKGKRGRCPICGVDFPLE